MHKIDIEYHIIISHINHLLNKSLITKEEYFLINKELIKKYNPLISEELLD